MKLTVEGGAFAYGRAHSVFEDIDFSVESGDFLAILGPNGAGKTTLLRCVTGMLRWTRGRSLLDGQDIRAIPARRLWSRLSYVPQARQSPVSCTALEAVLLGRSSRIGAFAQPSRWDIARAEQAMEQLGILDLRAKRCDEMSGGEHQMVLIARALASDPELIILDEPESSLDFRNQLIVLDTLSRLAQSGIACIFNTHYPEHALQRADKALILADGQARFGPTARVLTEANIERAFGVKAVIGEIETRETAVRSVIPLRLSPGAPGGADASPRDTLAAITVIFSDFDASPRINALFHEFNDIIVGRMGMPYRKRGMFIIHTTFDGEAARIDELTHRLSILPGVSVKAVYGRETEATP